MNATLERAIRPALDAAVAVGRAGLGASPPDKVPSSLRPVLRFSRLNPKALSTIRRAVEGDDGFRVRVAESVDEPGIGRASWLWLARPDGWDDELDALIFELDSAERESGAQREAAELRRTVATLEAAATAADEVIVRLERKGAEVRTEMAEQSSARAQAESDLEQSRAEVARLGEERTTAVRRMKELEADDATARGERRRLRTQVRELESRVVELSRPQVERDPDPAVAGGPPPTKTPDAASSWDRDAVADAVSIAAEASTALAQALAQAARALQTPPPASEAARPVDRRRAPVARRPSRRPVPLPSMMVDNTPEAVQHLLRRPDCVLLVDGYNISMAAWPDTPIPEQRQRLVDALNELHARVKVAATVVFDGNQAGRRAPGRTGREVKVLFTAAEEIADDRLVELVGEIDRPGPILLVTSDRELQRRGRTAGANIVSAQPFLAVLNR